MNKEALLENIRMWREHVGEASAKWGGAEICGVSKTIDPETINMAWEGGIRTLGENRVQELLGKIDALNPGYRIHLIGQLQTNKVKPIIDRVAMIQSVDREALARPARRREIRQPARLPEDRTAGSRWEARGRARFRGRDRSRTRFRGRGRCGTRFRGRGRSGTRFRC